MDKTLVVILAIIFVALGGLAFLYFYSPPTEVQPAPVANITTQKTLPFAGLYNGPLDGTLYGNLVSGINGTDYLGHINGQYQGLGTLNGKQVYFRTTISDGIFSGQLTGQHAGTLLKGTIKGDIQNAYMNGTLIEVSIVKPVTFKTIMEDYWWILVVAIIVVIIIWAIIRSQMGQTESISLTEIDMSIRYLLEGEPYDIEIKRFIRSRPIPNALKPKYHQLLYECKTPHGEYILVDGVYNKILRLHRHISGPDIKKIMDETTYQFGQPPSPYGGYGGYGGGGYYGRRGGRRTTRRTPPRTPPSTGMGGEYDTGGGAGGEYDMGY